VRLADSLRMTCMALVLAGMACSAQGQTAPSDTITFTIDPTRDTRPISRFIYGINRTLDGSYTNLTCTRVGGNRWTAYNWVANVSNAGSDYQFQNDDYLGGGNTPGGAIIPALTNALSHHAAVVLTIPINGYVAADKNGGGDVRRSGPDYLKTRFRPEAAHKGSAFTLTPDPHTAVVYQDEFVHWLKARFPAGFADTRQPIWFSLDNEPDLWSSTHAAVHPKPATYAELVAKTIEYAAAIKAVTPDTKIFGPVNYGWQGFVRLQNAPDAANRDFQEFYLQQMAQAQKKCGQRLLDVLDVHWYPEAQGGGVRITGQENMPQVVAARVAAPRSLWDATYTETSWITRDVLHEPLQLLPRLYAKIEHFYPGTKLAFTEYNYGGGNHISGAIAQADVLGIFGRAGVFAATQWPLAQHEEFIAAAFASYRNFDGKDGCFGDTAVWAQTGDAGATSIYASVDAANPHRMVFVLLNKTDRPIPAQVRIEHGGPFTRGNVFALTAAGAAPKPAGVITVTAGAFEYKLPVWSVCTFELSAANP